MKKFAQTADLGGAPIYKSDLAGTFNKEFWDVIEGILSQYQTETQGLIVSGCSITDHSGTTFDMTAGVVYLNGQFMRTSAVTGLSYPQYIQPATPVNDVRTFQNGNNITLETTYSAQFGSSAPGSGQYVSVTPNVKMGSMYGGKTFLKSPFQWNNFTLINGNTNFGNYYPNARWRFLGNGLVEVSGIILLAGSGSFATANFATIPTQWNCTGTVGTGNFNNRIIGNGLVESYSNVPSIVRGNRSLVLWPGAGYLQVSSNNDGVGMSGGNIIDIGCIFSLDGNI